jgi:hypothetical protein
MASDTVTSPSGRILVRRTRATTTPRESSEAKILRIAEDARLNCSRVTTINRCDG